MSNIMTFSSSAAERCEFGVNKHSSAYIHMTRKNGYLNFNLFINLNHSRAKIRQSFCNFSSYNNSIDFIDDFCMPRKFIDLFTNYVNYV